MIWKHLIQKSLHTYRRVGILADSVHTLHNHNLVSWPYPRPHSTQVIGRYVSVKQLWRICRMTSHKKIHRWKVIQKGWQAKPRQFHICEFHYMLIRTNIAKAENISWSCQVYRLDEFKWHSKYTIPYYSSIVWHANWNSGRTFKVDDFRSSLGFYLFRNPS